MFVCFFIDRCSYKCSVVTIAETVKQDLKYILCNLVCYERDRVGAGQVVILVSGQIVTR